MKWEKCTFPALFSSRGIMKQKKKIILSLKSATRNSTFVFSNRINEILWKNWNWAQPEQQFSRNYSKVNFGYPAYDISSQYRHSLVFPVPIPFAHKSIQNTGYILRVWLVSACIFNCSRTHTFVLVTFHWLIDVYRFTCVSRTTCIFFHGTVQSYKQ